MQNSQLAMIGLLNRNGRELMVSARRYFVLCPPEDGSRCGEESDAVNVVGTRLRALPSLASSPSSYFVYKQLILIPLCGCGGCTGIGKVPLS